MKLSLDELKVDSYAVQASETELAEVKGGTAWLCVDLGIAAATVIIAAYNAFKSNSNSSGGASGGASGGSSGGSTHVYGADSVKITNPDGSVHHYYGLDSLTIHH